MRSAVLFLTVLLWGQAAQAVQRETIVPERWRKTYETYQYAPAVRAGNMVYLSGVIGKGADPEEQFTSAFEEIERILKEAGASWDNVVEMTTFHVNLREHMATFMAVKEKFVDLPYPAWTAVGVNELLAKDGLVEIKVTAVLGARVMPVK